MSRIRLTWNNASTTIVEQRVYRSTSPLDIDDMPAPLAVLTRRSREYLDSTIEDGLTYYYAVSSVLPDYSELISEEIKVEASPGESDPHWDKVVSLLHFDGDYTDETGRVWTLGTGASIDNATPIFGTGSLRNSGAGNGCYSTNPIGDPSALFTFEGFVRFDALPVGQDYELVRSPLYGQSHNASHGEMGVAYNHVQERFILHLRGGVAADPSVYSEVFPIVLGQSYHFAHTYDGTAHRLFIDGVVIAVAPLSTGWKNTNQPFRIGQWLVPRSPRYHNWAEASFDELRITKGVARYTENFTPPTEPFPNN